MLQSVGSQRVGHDWVTRQQHGVCVCVPHVLEHPPLSGQLTVYHTSWSVHPSTDS